MGQTHPPCTPSPSCVTPLRCHPTLPPCPTPEKCLKTSKNKGRKPCESALSILKERAPPCACKQKSCRNYFGTITGPSDREVARNEKRKAQHIKKYFKEKDKQQELAMQKSGRKNLCISACRPPRDKSRAPKKKCCTIL